MANQGDYNIPLGIDPSGFNAGIHEAQAELVNLTASAKNATVAISQVMNDAGRNSDVLATKMQAGAGAAKAFQDAAKGAGVDIEKAFSPDRINTQAIDSKINQFITKVRDVAGKPVMLKFNLDDAKIALLNSKLKEAKGQVEGLGIVIDSAKDKLSNLAAGSKEFEDLNKQIADAENFVNIINAEGDAVADLGEKAAGAAPAVQSLKSRLKEMKEELAQMELAGQGGTSEFLRLQAAAGELSDQIGDTNQQVKALASDTKGLDAGISAIRGLAGAFAAGQGALAAFGETNEEAARAIQKVQGALAILQGIQEVANVLNKDSALIVYLKSLAIKEETAAIVTETVAIEAEAVATETATVATNTFTAALLRNPLVLIIAALAAVTFAVYKFATAEKEAGLSVDELNKRLKQQQDFLNEDQAIINRRIALSEAQANAERRNQSIITEIKLNGLKSRLAADQQDIIDQEAIIAQTRVTDEKGIEAKAAAEAELEKTKLKAKDTQNQIDVETINLQKLRQDEQIKLRLDFLNEKQIQANAEITIAKEAQGYLNQIAQIRINEIRDGQTKEIALARQAALEKIASLESEGAANIKNLESLRATLKLQFQAADENGKKLITKQLENNQIQIDLETEAGQKRVQLEQTILDDLGFQESQIAKKYADALLDFQYDIQVKNLDLEKDSANKRLELLELTAGHEIDLIKRQNLNKVQEEIAIETVTAKLKKDSAQALLDYSIQQINLEQQYNENRLLEQKGFFDRSRDGQALGHLLLLQNELEHQERILAVLILSGKQQTDAVLIEAEKRVAKLRAAVGQAATDAKAINIWEALFPGDEKSQKLGELFMKTLGEVGKAVQAYTSMLVEQYQKQVDAQKKKVSADDDAISNLNDQLKKEMELRDKGYANNVDLIRRELIEKNKQRDEDLKKQEEYQKRLEKAQAAQARAQSVVQAANLITAATQIYFESSKLGPIGVAIGAVAIAAMLAAFISAKASANSAANKFRHGGIIGGKSHDQGGQRYYANDNSGVVMELEEGEFVVKREQSAKHMDLLKAINENKIPVTGYGDLLNMINESMHNKKGGNVTNTNTTTSIMETHFTEMLAAAGVHLMNDAFHTEALKESRIDASNQIMNLNFHAPKAPELARIDENISRLVDAEKNRAVVYDDGDFVVIKQGNKVTRIKKSK